MTMNSTRAMAIACASLIGAGMAPARAQTTSLVNFDPPATTQGPSIYVAVPGPQTIDTAPAVFSGGVVLGLATFFPAILFASSPNVYGTADFGNGLSKLLTIDVKPGTVTTEVSFALFNGETFNQAYVIKAYDAGKGLLSSQTTSPIVPNFSSGYALVDILSASNIASVTVEAQSQPAVWDFLIDSVAFNQNITSVFPNQPPPPVYVPNVPAPIVVDPIVIQQADTIDAHGHKQNGKKVKGFINYGDDITNAKSHVLEFTSPVPESSTWALLLAGLAGLGWKARRSARAAEVLAV
jgi:hypothetical protein